MVLTTPLLALSLRRRGINVSCCCNVVDGVAIVVEGVYVGADIVANVVVGISWFVFVQDVGGAAVVVEVVARSGGSRTSELRESSSKTEESGTMREIQW